MCIYEHFGKIADGLVCVNPEKQRNRLGHQVPQFEERLTAK
jgi:hypothetical protein